MDNVTTIGLDIAKSVFQVHGVDAVGAVVIRRKLTRGRVLGFFEKLPRCLVGIEACSSSHYWARELIARGHANLRMTLIQRQTVSIYAACLAVPLRGWRMVGLSAWTASAPRNSYSRLSDVVFYTNWLLSNIVRVTGGLMSERRSN